jgi:aminoglycoside phosphotransferase (APT) family kinase protein
VLPSAAGRIGALCERIGAPHRMSDTATVHGDLHDGQLAVDGRGRITAMLDVDAVGPGERVDDLANLLGHLASLELSSRPAAGNVRTWADELHGVFAAQVDAAELDRRVAAVLLGLATGPFRVQERAWRTAVRRRLSLAERWAGRGERTLRTAS